MVERYANELNLNAFERAFGAFIMHTLPVIIHIVLLFRHREEHVLLYGGMY